MSASEMDHLRSDRKGRDSGWHRRVLNVRFQDRPVGRSMAGMGGNATYPICPADKAHPSKAVINGPTHPTLRLFQFFRW